MKNEKQKGKEKKWRNIYKKRISQTNRNLKGNKPKKGKKPKNKKWQEIKKIRNQNQNK